MDIPIAVTDAACAATRPAARLARPSARSLAPTALIDSDHAAVMAFAAAHAVGADDRERGSFDDLPLDAVLLDFRLRYPRWLANMAQQRSADFMAEVGLETAAGAASAANPGCAAGGA